MEIIAYLDRNIKWEDKTMRYKEETRLRQYTSYLTGMKIKMCLDFNFFQWYKSLRTRTDREFDENIY